ncbi:hypothetical protein ES703_106947 [subsurface metagenome]
MVDEMKVTPGRGGNRHPVSVRAFILGHLAAAGEDYGANIHRAYKAELDRIAREKGRRYRYHRPTCASFQIKVHALARDGLIEFSREEESDNPKVEWLEVKPVRRYYRLK